MADSNINIEITEETPISIEIVEETPVNLEIVATGPAGSGGEQTYDEYIYNSSGAQTGNRYNDWQDLIDAIHAGQEGPVRITFEQAETLPAGDYNLDYITFNGSGEPLSLGGFTVTLPNGFNVTSWISGRISGALGVSYTGSDALVTWTTGINLFDLLEGARITTTASSFFSCTGGIGVIRLEDGCSLVNGGYEPVNLANPTLFVVRGSSGSDLANNIFRGDISGGFGLVQLSSAASLISTSRTDANLTGAMNVQLSEQASRMAFDNSTNGFDATNVQDAIEELSTNTSELLSLEDRTHYAFVGGGSLANYSAGGFILPSQGDFPDGGFDIYQEVVPIWGFYGGGSPLPEYGFGEVFTIEDPLASGGDLVETAIVYKGSRAYAFVELTAQGEPGEDPVITSDNYYSDSLFLVRQRFTHDPTLGITRIWRVVREGETGEDTAFGLDWIVTDERDQGGAWPIKSGNTEDLLIGKGGGRRLVSRLIVNGFDGTPMADFNAEDFTSTTTVPDPIAGVDWTAVDGKIISSQEFAEFWLGVGGNQMKLIGTYSFGSDSINFYEGASGVDIDSYDAQNGDVLRCRTAGSRAFGGDTITLAVDDYMIYDSIAGKWKILAKPVTLEANKVPYTGASTNVNLGSNSLTTSDVITTDVQAQGSAGVIIKNSGGTAQAEFGSGGGTNATINGTTNVGTASADYHQVAGGTGTITDTATGTSTNIDINLVPKGTGRLKEAGTNLKKDSMATNKLLGRGTAGTGAIEEITLGTGLSLSGTTLNGSTGASLLAYAERSSSTNDTISSTSPTLTAVDTTNLRVTFTAPSSGNVIVKLFGSSYNGTGSGAPTISWGILNGSTNVAIGVIDGNPPTTFTRLQSYTRRITGLTPGASYTWDWGVASSDHTLRPAIFRTASTYVATMEVWGV